jgi:hypothetical protein
MLPVGFDHAKDHSVLALAVNLFAILKAIPLTITDSCSYRKAGLCECQGILRAASLGYNVSARVNPQWTITYRKF